MSLQSKKNDKADRAKIAKELGGTIDALHQGRKSRYLMSRLHHGITYSNTNGTANPTVSAGAIAGIVIGLFLFILILVFLLWRRRRQQAFSSSTTASPSNRPISTALLSSSPTNAEKPTTESPPPNPISTISQSNPSPTSLATTVVSPPSGYPTPSGLTPEDAQFFNSLHALNVPAADIVSMMETLRVEREAAANANRIWQ